MYFALAVCNPDIFIYVRAMKHEQKNYRMVTLQSAINVNNFY